PDASRAAAGTPTVVGNSSLGFCRRKRDPLQDTRHPPLQLPHAALADGPLRRRPATGLDPAPTRAGPRRTASDCRRARQHYAGGPRGNARPRDDAARPGQWAALTLAPISACQLGSNPPDRRPLTASRRGVNSSLPTTLRGSEAVSK